MEKEKVESLTLNLVYYRGSQDSTGKLKLFVEMEFLYYLQTSFMHTPSGLCKIGTGNAVLSAFLGTGCQK